MPSARPPFSPRRFGSYWLVEHLGDGGMGAVYLARREGIQGIDRLCVVKTMRAELARTPESVSRFTEEARVATRLNHRNICPVFDVGRVGEEHYLAMDMVAGIDVETLFRRLLKRGRVLPVAVSLYLACEMLEALDYAHRLTDPVSGAPLQSFHRDVSPHNVMVTFEGEVKLIDFGLARSTMRAAGADQTGEHIVVGKLKYMAPEQARSGTVDARADQYAAAVMLTELLTGERFFEGVDEEKIPQLVVAGGFRPRAFDRIDSPVRSILVRALAPESARRFSSCRAFLEAIDALPVRHDPGAGRALRSILESELDDEKRALRARLALGSGRMPSWDDESIDPSAPTLVRKVEGLGRLRETPQRHIDVSEDEQLTVAIETNTLATTLEGPAVTVVEEQPPEPAPAPVARKERSASAATASVVGFEIAKPKRSRTPFLVAAGLIAAVAVAVFAVAVVVARPPRRVDPTDVIAPSPIAPSPIAPSPIAPSPISPTPVGGSLIAPTPVAPSPVAVAPPVVDAGTPEPAAPVDPAPTTAPVATDVPLHAAKIPPPPKAGTLKDSLDYLDKNCRKRARCAAPLLEKRAAVAGMAAGGIMHFVDEADQCARRCYRER